MPSPVPAPSPLPAPGGAHDAPAARLARTGARLLTVAAIGAVVAAVLTGVLAASGAVGAAVIVLVIAAVLLGVVAGVLLAAVRTHARQATAPGASVGRPAALAATDGGEPVSDDEIEAARDLFGRGQGPASHDPSWTR